MRIQKHLYHQFLSLLNDKSTYEKCSIFLENLKQSSMHFEEDLHLLLEIAEKRNHVLCSVVLYQARGNLSYEKGDYRHAFAQYLNGYLLCNEFLDHSLLFDLYQKVIYTSLDLSYFVICDFFCNLALQFSNKVKNKEMNTLFTLLHLRVSYITRNIEQSLLLVHNNELDCNNNPVELEIEILRSSLYYINENYTQSLKLVQSLLLQLEPTSYDYYKALLHIVYGKLENVLDNKDKAFEHFMIAKELNTTNDLFVDIQIHLQFASYFEYLDEFEYTKNINYVFSKLEYLKSNLDVLRFDQYLTECFAHCRPLLAKYHTMIEMKEQKEKTLREESDLLMHAMQRLTYLNTHLMEQRVTLELSSITKVGSKLHFYGSNVQVLHHILHELSNLIPLHRFGCAWFQNTDLLEVMEVEQSSSTNESIKDISSILYQRSCANNEVLHIESFEKEASKYSIYKDLDVRTCNQTQLYIPLQFENQQTAVISFQCLQKRSFSKKVVSTFQILSTYIAFTLRSNRLVNEAMFDAEHDSLTKTVNHRKILSITQHVLEDVPVPSGLVMIDIDYFKTINDTYGHFVGDHALLHLVHILKQSLRKVDTLGRYGGEEFLIVLPSVDKEMLEIITERLRQSIILHPFVYQDQSIPFTISIGATIMDDRLMSVKDYIVRSDQALYESKNTGRNKITIF